MWHGGGHNAPVHPVTRRTLVATAPAGVAIAVFGTIFGALFRPLGGTLVTLLMSALVFSGALQFTVASLLVAGGGPPAILAAAVMLNLRHLLLGAALRPRLRGKRTRRALVASLLTDEAAGFALAEQEDADRALLVAGIVCYVSWQLGTVLGLVGASAPGFQQAAGAVFPVLFIGLSALAATARDHVVRALAAALFTLAVALAWPAARSLAPALAAVVVSLPGRSS